MLGIGCCLCRFSKSGKPFFLEWGKRFLLIKPLICVTKTLISCPPPLLPDPPLLLHGALDSKRGQKDPLYSWNVSISVCFFYCASQDFARFQIEGLSLKQTTNILTHIGVYRDHVWSFLEESFVIIDSMTTACLVSLRSGSLHGGRSKQ